MSPSATPAGARRAPRGASARRVGTRTALVLCMLVAGLNAAAWGFLTPTFQTPDEPVHVGYTEFFAETGHLPQPGQSIYSPPAEADATFSRLPWSIASKPSWSAANNAALQRYLRRPTPRDAPGGAGYLSSNPPLYYVLEAVPYRIAEHGTFLDRLYAMRLLSALLAALTTGFTFLFLRELLPGWSWTWALGSLAVGLQPVFGFIAGGVNSDNALWAASAALLWLLARAFRRGLTAATALAIPVAIAAGVLTKSSTFGLVPGVVVGVALIAARAPRERRRRQLGLAAVAAGGTVAAVLGSIFVVNALLLSRSSSTTTAGFTQQATQVSSLAGELTYLWQFYLPKLPFMQDWFSSYPTYPLWNSYFEAFVGRFGWFAFGFPTWVSFVGLGVAIAVCALVVRVLWRGRARVRARWHELLTYVLLLAGLALLVNVAGYHYRVQAHANFEQVRYLFPLLPLYGALVALAPRGAGRRWAPAVGAALLVVLVAQSVFSQLLVVAHYFA